MRNDRIQNSHSRYYYSARNTSQTLSDFMWNTFRGTLK